MSDESDLRTPGDVRPGEADPSGAKAGLTPPSPPDATDSSSSAFLNQLASHTPPRSRYTLKGEVARGGMGAILEVWDADLRRQLAMKVVLGAGEPGSDEPSPTVDDKTLGRFLEEAQVTGQLDHPGVVPVHELGVDREGRVYFTMQLVKGEDLRSVFVRVRNGEDDWSRARALGVLLKACEALAYAHSHGVVHRDLKPGNIMVGQFGEVYVMDWGLAKVAGRADTKDLRLKLAENGEPGVQTLRRDEVEGTPGSPLVTMDGDVMGTPAYMPPEQAHGRIAELGPRSDVYAMGAILYQLLTGHPPYVPSGTKRRARSILHDVQGGPPAPVRSLVKDVPPELEAICETAMARDPADRYADVIELARDLRAYLEQRVVGVYETGAVAELRKWVVRNKPLAASLAAVFVLALAAGGIFAQLSGELTDKNTELNETNRDLDVALEDANDQRALAETNAEAAQLAAVVADDARHDALSALTRANEVKRIITDMLRVIRPELALSADTTLLEGILEDTAQRLLAGEIQDELVAAELHQVIGLAYLSLSKYAAAEAHLPRVLEIHERLSGDDFEGLQIARNNLAILYRKQGRPDKALVLAEQALAAQRRDLGDAHEFTAASMVNVASMYMDLQRYDEAIALYEDATAFFEASRGPEDPNALQARMNMAVVYKRQGKLDEAETMYIELREVRVRVSGREHPATLALMSNLAEVWRLKGKHEESVELFEETLELQRRVQGEEHEDTLTAMTTLASLKFSMGLLEEAETLFVDVLRIQRRALGEDHPLTIGTLLNSGFLYEQMGRLDDARERFEQSVESCRRVLGVGHPWFGVASIKLMEVCLAQASEHFEQGAIDDAIADQRTALEHAPPDEPELRAEIEAKLAEYEAARNGSP